MTYSVAIRTLGTAGEKFQRELISLHHQTIEPERIVVYIAEGYKRPDFTIGKEQYVWVKKGMVAQRAQPYDEITSDCILLLDDDVELAPDSAERMLTAMVENNADCVGADTFKNQELAFKQKLFAALTNWVFPHCSSSIWAFKIHRHGSFSYNNNPTKSFYWSQSCAGPASMWKKSVIKTIRVQDEVWLDTLGFPFGEDMVTFYKLHINGYKLGILYDSGIKNLDGKTSSGNYQKNIQKFHIRSKASLINWWRLCYDLPSNSQFDRLINTILFALKCFWLFFINIIAGIRLLDIRVPVFYMKGLFDGIKFVHSKEYQNIPPYILQK